MPFQLEVPIARPPSVVFAYLADATNTPVWYEAVHSADRLDDGPADGPVRLGSRYRLQRRLPGLDAVNVVEVTELETDSLYTLTSVEGPTPFRYRYRLTPAPRGGTLLRLTGEIRGDGLAGRAAVFAALAQNLIARGMRTNLERLQSILEQGGDPGQRGLTAR